MFGSLHRNAWTEERARSGARIDYPALSTKKNTNHETSEFFLYDRSYLRLKNIELGYTLPRRWTSKIGFKAARVSASVDNLCIFTHLKGMDPQYSLTGGTSYAYAPTRTVSFNLDLKF